MQILGLGVDLADIDRVGQVLAKYPRFADRCFTDHEREYAFRFATPERRLAARFAGKEAVMKSMGTGWRRIRWRASDPPLVRAQAPACGYVIPELGQNVPVRSAHNSGTLLVTGSDPDFAYIRSIPVAEGRYPNREDEADVRRVAFLGSDAKKQLFAERPAVGETIHIREFPYIVVGVMEHKEQDSSYDGRDISKVFVPFQTILQDMPNGPPDPPDYVDRLLVAPRSLEDHEDCERELRAALARLHDFDPRDEEAAHIWDTVKEAKAFSKLTNGMKYFLGAVGIVTLFIGGIGVMNVMLVAVRERTREIGVRKAMGATRRSIVRMFFLETMIVVFLSGGLGLAVGYGFCALVNLIPMPPFFAGLLPTWTSSFLAFALLGTVALLSALYPARRAASIDPIEALRFEAGG